MAKRDIDVWWDTINNVFLNSEGYELRSADYPYITYKEKPLMKLRLVAGDVDTALTGINPADTFEAAADNEYDHSSNSPLILKTLDENINVDGDWPGVDGANAALGRFSIRLDGFTASFLAHLQSKSQIGGPLFELQVLEFATGDLVQVFQFPLRCINIINNGGAAPPAPSDDYYTKGESNARYYTKDVLDPRILPDGVRIEEFTDGGVKKIRVINSDGQTVGDIMAPMGA